LISAAIAQVTVTQRGITVHNAAEIMYLVLAVLFAFLLFQSSRGLLPHARPRYWPSRITGLKSVRLSKLSLVSVVCLYLGTTAAFLAAAFEAETFGLLGLFILVVGFISAAVSRSKDVRSARHHRMGALIPG
jgi:hypothetical protein